ncbi:MAG: SMI1/KNR4 family protein [Armatimonadota bacterium]
MSYENYLKAVSIMEEHKESCFFAGRRSEELVSLAERTLGLQFPKTYREFVLNYGAGSFGAEEIYGVINDDFVNSCVPDVVWYNLRIRKDINLPQNLLIIYHTGGDYVNCLDFNKLNNDGEPAVVDFAPGFDLSIQTYEKIADDFGDFLLDSVTQELEFQSQEE